MAQIVADRVKETSTTTGTGALTLAGAVTGFRAFSAVCTTNDTCYYAIQAVDGSGVPTGDWEVGLGTYSGANTLTRTTVLASSNAGAAVSLAAGTKQVWLDVPADQLITMQRFYAQNTFGAVSGTAHATKGNLLVPLLDMVIDGLFFYVDEINAATYMAGIYELSTNTISSVLATVNATATATVNNKLRYFEFSSPVTLTAGTRYVLTHTRTDSTATTSSGVHISTSDPNAPVAITNLFMWLDSIAPAVSDTFTTGSNCYTYGFLYRLV